MDHVHLKRKLESLDGRGYKAYKQIRGAYSFHRFTLFIDYVQGDPYAAPSRLRVRVPREASGFPPALSEGRARRVALEDYLARAFRAAIRKHVKGRRGSGRSGMVDIDSGGQEILERTAALVTDEFVELRFVVGLPAAGRRCLGREAQAILGGEVPVLVEESLSHGSLDAGSVKAHVEAAEDQQALRELLAESGLVAFVADGAVLPRESGVSDLPLGRGRVVEFRAPAELRVEFDLPNRGRVGGMGIPEGVTLVTGGGYHGKSTLLKALERGVYDHVPGDGRELVVTRADAVKIRAEDGRRVEKVDISPLIADLPFDADTTAFSTENASGSTSQAANIVEALEVGSRLLLIDEDTSATNFMIRDEMMQRLIAKEKEPITPFIDQVDTLYREHGVSTVLVMGGSGDYFEVADTVIAMENYQPKVVTQQAREIVASHPGRRRREGGGRFGALVERCPRPGCIDPARGRKEKVSVRGTKTIVFGSETVDVGLVEQLVDESQARAIAEMARHAVRAGYVDGDTSMRELLARVLADVEQGGLDVISPHIAQGAPTGAHPGDFALPRGFELAAMLNRLRSLRIEQRRPAAGTPCTAAGHAPGTRCAAGSPGRSPPG